MSVLIKGMEMPKTGVYTLSVDNTGKDKTIFTIAIHTKSGKIIPKHVGEAINVQPHGRLIDADALEKVMSEGIALSVKDGGFKHPFDIIQAVANAPTIIKAEEVKE